MLTLPVNTLFLGLLYNKSHLVLAQCEEAALINVQFVLAVTYTGLHAVLFPLDPSYPSVSSALMADSATSKAKHFINR